MLRFFFLCQIFTILGLQAYVKKYHTEGDPLPREGPASFEKPESVLRADIVSYARSKVGKAKYVWGKPPPDTGMQYDCSGFAQWMTIEALTYDPFGEKIGSGQFYSYLNEMGAKLESCDQARPGDIIHWEGHVGIVVDTVNQTFIGAQGKAYGITEASYKDGYWAKGKTCFTNKFLVPDYKREI